MAIMFLLSTALNFSFLTPGTIWLFWGKLLALPILLKSIPWLFVLLYMMFWKMSLLTVLCIMTCALNVMLP